MTDRDDIKLDVLTTLHNEGGAVIPLWTLVGRLRVATGQQTSAKRIGRVLEVLCIEGYVTEEDGGFRTTTVNALSDLRASLHTFSSSVDEAHANDETQLPKQDKQHESTSADLDQES